MSAFVAAAVIATPLVVQRGTIDVFRTPKDVVFELLALAIFAVAAAGALLRDDVARRLMAARTPLLAAAAVLLWTCMASWWSLKPAVSMFKPLTVFCAAVFFAAALFVARGRGLLAICIALVPAAVNAVLAILQATGVLAPWSWIEAPVARRLATTALVGNPNEVGGYLVLPALAAIAAAMVWPRRRWLYAVAVVICAGVLAAQSLTSLLALAAGLVALVFTPAARRVRLPAIILLAAFAAGLLLYPGSRARIRTAIRHAAAGDLSAAGSFRLPAWTVAAKMFAERPLTGVGPGTFGALYMPYRVSLDERYPQWIQFNRFNFSEAHNDHLQILAETGIPGYALFLTSLVLLARLSFRRTRDADPRHAFAQTFGFPAAAAFFVLCLAHFPLQLTSTIVPALYLAALCFAWTTADEDA